MTHSQQPADSFRELATSYCALVEGVEAFDGNEILDRLAVLLPSLLSVAPLLPRLEPTSALPGPRVSHEAWLERFTAIDLRLVSGGDYWTTMDVHGYSEPEVVNLSLADALAEIWRDLKEGLDLLASGGDVRDAVWTWRYGYQSSWGAYAVEALRSVHYALCE